jgi:hypothetical protein
MQLLAAIDHDFKLLRVLCNAANGSKEFCHIAQLFRLNSNRMACAGVKLCNVLAAGH